MYFSVFHTLFVFVCTVLVIFALGLNYYFYRLKGKNPTAKKELIGYGSIIVAIYVIFSAGGLMALDGYLKSSQLLNIKHSPIGDEIIISASIKNTGKVAIATCEINIRVVNDASRKVDGSIFAPRWFDANKLDKKRFSYEFSEQVQRIILPNRSEMISLKVPKPFKNYKLRARMTCK